MADATKNPFSDPSITSLAPSTLSPPPYSEYTIQGDSFRPTQDVVRAATQDLDRQQESLERAASNLERWEPNENSRTVIQIDRIKNYPPLPPCCPIRPCFYQDIGLEIPSLYQRIVRFHFIFWIAYSVQLAINVAGCVVWFAVVDNKLSAGVSLGVSLGYLFIIMPCAYVCWFRPLYNAFRSDSSLNFFWYFFVFFAQVVVLIVDSIGFFYYGTVGWINAFIAFESKVSYAYGIGIFMIIVGILFDVLAVIGFILLFRVNYMYRRTSASFEQARHELTASIANNPNFQQAASGAVAGAAQGATQAAVDGTLFSQNHH